MFSVKKVFSGRFYPFFQEGQNIARRSISSKHSFCKTLPFANADHGITRTRIFDLCSARLSSAQRVFSSIIVPESSRKLTPVEVFQENEDFDGWFIISSKNGSEFESETVENLTVEHLSVYNIALFLNGSFVNFQNKTNFDDAYEIPPAKTQLKLIHKLIESEKAILLYSRLTRVEKKYQSTNPYFKKSFTIIEQILKINPLFLEERYLPIFGHSHGGVLELHARNGTMKELPLHLHSKIPLIMFGMGAWQQSSFVEALELLATSSSPTIVYFLCEDGLVLRGLNNIIKNPESSVEGKDIELIMKNVFDNKNNFIYFTEDKTRCLNDSTGKNGHEFTKYLERAEPLIRMIGQKNYNWENFSTDVNTVQLFSDSVKVYRVQGLDLFYELLNKSQELMEAAKSSKFPRTLGHCH